MSDSEASSESDSFYDAEDSFNTSDGGRKGGTLLACAPGGSNLPSAAVDIQNQPTISVTGPGSPAQVNTSIQDLNNSRPEEELEILTGDQLAIRDQRWRRLEELRRKKEAERQGSGVDGDGGAEVDHAGHGDSAESSVEGIYVSGVRSSHPFKVVESDARSNTSDPKSVARSVSQTTEPVNRIRLSVDEQLSDGVISLSRESSVEPEFRFSKSEQVFHSDCSVAPNLVPDIVSSSTKPANSPNLHPSTQLNLGDQCSSLQRQPSPNLGDLSRQTSTASSCTPTPTRQASVSSPKQTRSETSAIPPPTLNLQHPTAPPRRKKRNTESGENSPTDTIITSVGTTVSLSDCGLETPNVLNSLPSSSRDNGTLDSGAPPTRSSIRSYDSRIAAGIGARMSVRSRNNLDNAYSNIDAMSGLNINLACRGDFVVKPQDDEHTRRSDDRLVSNLVDDHGIQSSAYSQDPAGGSTSSSHHQYAHNRNNSKSKSPTEEKQEDVRSIRGHKSGGSGGQRSEGHVSGGSGGYHSGGSGGHHSSSRAASGRGSGGSDRRSAAGSIGSAGSDGIIKQLGMYVRTKSDSGKKLSDAEILQQIKVKNLDTGCEMDLATAEDQLPPAINPLSLHIMRLTSEYSGTMSNPSTYTEGTSYDSDTESIISSVSEFTIGQDKKKTFNKLFTDITKGANKFAKHLSTEINKRQKTREEKAEEKMRKLETNISTTDGVQVSRKDAEMAEAQNFKRIQAHKAGPYDFENIQFGQDLSGHHSGPIWCMKFSLCGRLLATAGQDCILRIWVLQDKYNYFNEMRRRYQVEHEGITEAQVEEDEITQSYLKSPDSRGHIFMDRPFLTYTGHTSDLLDISWSNNFFILTSSMDKTVRLWHVSRKECLCVFQHIDFVTAIGFHPRNDKFFISGSLDGKIRLWNIPDKKVALWTEVDGPTKLITAANFCSSGKFAVVGTYDGRCIFYSTDQLKYHTTIDVKSTRGKNARGRKVTGIEPMPGEDKILVTSTDSRIRLYDLRDLSLICKYRGYSNLSSQIRAGFSPDGRYITAGSENHCVFLWSCVHLPPSLTVRKDRNNYYEAIKAHNAVVTCTLFAPVPELIFEAVERGREAAGKQRETPSDDILGDKEPLSGYVVISGDYDGDIKVFIKEGKKKNSLPR